MTRRLGLERWTAADTARALGLGGLILALATLGGCRDEYVVVGDCSDPHPPYAVSSLTGDGEVTVYWTPSDDVRDHSFVVYRARRANGPYYAVGETTRDWFVDRGARNGETYYYAVSAVNDCGWESELSRELAMDTPRPEGFDAYVYDANGEDWRRSAWDFDGFRPVPWDAGAADLIYLVEDGVPFLVAADEYTDIQDAGYVHFDDVGWAPDGGWSPTGTAEAIEGHVYVVWTRDDHYAKLRIRSVGANRIVFDWAYQIDRGNPELKPGRRGGLDAELRGRLAPS